MHDKFRRLIDRIDFEIRSSENSEAFDFTSKLGL
jgi:hypothetical protein